VLLRPDRVGAVSTRLPRRWLRPADGWSDDPADPAYNRPVSHPHPWSAERLWRDDGAYDAIVVLGHNDAPVRAGLGSAVFLHVAQPDWRATEGCVAVELPVLLGLIGRLEAGAELVIA
jgi:L,D-peptidoglycan transpeptidase YkuD (ErfK/YbiS/YcfS/YnhG family)